MDARLKPRLGFPCGRVILLGLAFVVAPPMLVASSPKALGTVEEAEQARLGGGSAVSGATVYVGDIVETESHGALKLHLGTVQLYLSAASSASLEERAGLATVTLAKGTARFSLPDPTQFELETPAGTLRGSGTRATRGQVAISGAHEIVVIASHGDLVLDNDGDFYTIPEGKSFRIVIEEDSSSPRLRRNAPRNLRQPKRKLLFFSIAESTLDTASLKLRRDRTES